MGVGIVPSLVQGVVCLVAQQLAPPQRAIRLADVTRIVTPAQRRSGIDVTSSPAPQNECAIAIDPSNPLRMAIVAHDCDGLVAHTAVWHSFDGGKSWSGARFGDLNPALTVHLKQADPAIAAWRGGVFYCSFLDYDGSEQKSDNRLVVGRSDDGGVTWPGVGIVAANEGVLMAEDKPYLAVDDSGGPFDGNVYVAWSHVPSSGIPRIWFVRSTDGAATFRAPLRLSSGTSATTGALPVIGPDGEVYVVWTKGNRIEGTVSTDGCVTFEADRVVTTFARVPLTLPGASFRVSPFAALAVDRSDGPERGTVYVAWADDNGTGQGPDVLLRRSSDGGTSWSSPVRVSGDTNGSYQVFPWMCVGPDGAVNVVFVDQRDTPGSPLYHVYLARSTDGGHSFQRNIRLTDEASDSTLDGFGGAFLGDYIGIAASPLGVFPVWTDVRPSNGQAEIYLRALRFRSL